MGTFLAILVAFLVVTISAVAYVKRHEPRAPWQLVVLLLWATFLVDAWIRQRRTGAKG